MARRLTAPPPMPDSWIRRNWFIAGLAAAAVLAFVMPELGARGGPLRPGVTTKLAVALIFLLQGLAIPPSALRAGASRWRLHVVTQLFVFGAFPAAILVLDRAAGAALSPELRLGFLLLAILPTTVSSCVVLTATAGGNVSGALFNAAFANVAGVAITPLWGMLLLEARGAGPALLPMMGEIAGLLVAPLAVGQLLRRRLGRQRQPRPAVLTTMANVVLLYVVFVAFAGSVQTGAFGRAGPSMTLLVAGAATVLFAAATGAAHLIGRRLGFDSGDRRALLFCAPQKTLAAGVPMAHILFEGHPAVGLILLPLIVYHAVQLVIGSSMADRLARSAPHGSAAGSAAAGSAADTRART